MTISRIIAWSSGASGVVLPAVISRSPMRYFTVPISPHRIPAASKIALTRYPVVVFPFVPVMPTTRICRLGCPANSAASHASASRASLTTIHGTVGAAGTGRSATTAAAPASIA
jgi:hypothetical protein